jgi:pimeloyl-ACP methyl ester carboxylesterase
MTEGAATTSITLSNGRTLAWADYGDPTGPVVFAFHGTPGGSSQFESFGEVAAGMGVRVIAPDRPGYGRSSFDPHRSLLDWPADVEAIANELEVDRFGVVGVSGGGPHSAVSAYALAGRLTGAVIVAGVAPMLHSADTEGMMPVNRALFSLAKRLPRAASVPFAAMSLASRALPEERLRGQMTAQLPTADVETIARPGVFEELTRDLAAKHPTAARAAAQDFTLIGRPWGFALQDITVPVHIWHGDADVNVPVSHGHRYAELIADATLHLEPGLGHMLLYDRGPEVLNAATGSPTPTET